MNQEPKEMTLIGGGLSSKEQQEIFGGRCVCSGGSSRWNVEGGQINNCQCGNGWENANANLSIAFSVCY